VEITLQNDGVFIQGDATCFFSDAEKKPKHTADVVLWSTKDTTYDNNIFSWPGEYEKSNILITGNSLAKNTLFHANVEGIRYTFLPNKLLEADYTFLETYTHATEVFIFSLPADISDKYITSLKKLLEKLDPAMIIYISSENNKSPEYVSGKLGREIEEKSEKLKITKKDIHASDMKFIVLSR
jgi:hypothetical protein